MFDSKHKQIYSQGYSCCLFMYIYLSNLNINIYLCFYVHISTHHYAFIHMHTILLVAVQTMIHKKHLLKMHIHNNSY